MLPAANGTSTTARGRSRPSSRPDIQHAAGTGRTAVGRDRAVQRRDLSKWQTEKATGGWKIESGAMVVAAGSGAIRTKDEFGDCQLHVEWSAPSPPKGTGQDRGTACVPDEPVRDSGARQLWNQTYRTDRRGDLRPVPPLVNASRKPGEWQVYDIVFTAPRFNGRGSPRRHGDGLSQRDRRAHRTELIVRRAPRARKYEAHPPKAPIMLQDHAHPVRYATSGSSAQVVRRAVIGSRVVAGRLSRWVRAGGRERHGACVAQCAAVSREPEHVWNRLHAALFVRVAPDGREYGGDRVDPLLWSNSKYWWRGRRTQSRQLLTEFVDTHAEKLIDDPLKRARCCATYGRCSIGSKAFTTRREPSATQELCTVARNRCEDCCPPRSHASRSRLNRSTRCRTISRRGGRERLPPICSPRGRGERRRPDGPMARQHLNDAGR